MTTVREAQGSGQTGGQPRRTARPGRRLFVLLDASGHEWSAPHEDRLGYELMRYHLIRGELPRVEVYHGGQWDRLTEEAVEDRYADAIAAHTCKRSTIATNRRCICCGEPMED